MTQETEKKSVADASLPTCPCGFNKHSPMVQAKGVYTAWGHFLVTFGISYTPLKIRYLCLKCDSYFDETNNPNELINFT